MRSVTAVMLLRLCNHGWFLLRGQNSNLLKLNYNILNVLLNIYNNNLKQSNGFKNAFKDTRHY